MNTIIRCISSLLVMLAPAVWAAGPGAPPKEAAAHGASKDKTTWLDMRASELIGKHVANPEGKSLGKVEDLIVDMKGGHIPHVVLSFGGVADVGDKLFVFPVNAFTRDEYRDRIVLKAEREQLAQSKGFDRSNWPFQPPLERASRLRGKNVGLEGGKRGELEDVVVNLGSGSVRGVIVAQDGRKGDEPKLTLPLSALDR
jgi:sporulation protein YlmC with PRC-barrel domain